MPRYRAMIPTVDAQGYHGTICGENVVEADRSPISTGLLDASGTPIYRVSESITLGFDIPAVRRVTVAEGTVKKNLNGHPSGNRPSPPRSQAASKRG